MYYGNQEHMTYLLFHQDLLDITISRKVIIVHFRQLITNPSPQSSYQLSKLFDWLQKFCVFVTLLQQESGQWDLGDSGTFESNVSEGELELNEFAILTNWF